MNKTFKSFEATHALTYRLNCKNQHILVALDGDVAGDGPAYTAEEYVNFKSAAWQVVDGQWLLYGEPAPEFKVQHLQPGRWPAVIGAIQVPVDPLWKGPDLPVRVQVRTDGSVVLRGMEGAPRVYKRVADFCKFFRVYVDFIAPASASPIQYIRINHTGQVHVRHRCQPLVCEYDEHAPIRHVDDSGFYWWVAQAQLDCRELFFKPEDLRELARHMAWLQSFGTPTLPEGSLCMKSPESVIPQRGRIDADKIRSLAADMKVRGWSGLPIVIEKLSYGANVAWNGRHRILAARRAGLAEIPCVYVDLTKWEAAHGAPGPHGAVFDTRDEMHRAMLLGFSEDALPAYLVSMGILGALEN